MKLLLQILLTMILAIGVMGKVALPLLFAQDISNLELVEYVNQEREKRSLHPLKYNRKLQLAAEQKAMNMFQVQYWAHYGPNKESPWQFITGSGYTYTYAGENLAKGFFSTTAVHEAWMNSPTHRDNILDPSFDEVGIAVMKGKLLGAEVYLVVQMFGSKEYRTGVRPRGTYPILSIISPKDGDILNTGEFSIRGEGSQLRDESISVYEQETIIGTANAVGSQYTFIPQAPLESGEKVFVVKSTGVGEEYLRDQVTVKLLSDTGLATTLTSCLHYDVNVAAYTISLHCANNENLAIPQLFTAQIGSTVFKAETDTIEIPKSAVPAEQTDVSLSYKGRDGKQAVIKKPLEAIGIVSVHASQNGGQTPPLLSALSIRDIGLVIAAIFGVLFIVYGLLLLRKHQLAMHKIELFVMGMLFCVGVVTLVSGAVYV